MTSDVKLEEKPESKKGNGTGFSKVVAIELYNVMRIKEARLEFDETGIISLVGYNDSGKSAITRACEILLYDEYKNEQAKYIHGKEEYMGIGFEFDDGVSINKYKYRNGNSVWEMLKGDETIYTNQLNGTIAAMPTVPEPIKKYLRVIKDSVTGEKLNVRRNTDRLFLIDTTGGDNYKIFNAVLKLTTLSNSVEKLNTEANRLQTELTVKASTNDALRANRDQIKFMPEQVIKGLKSLKSNLIKLRLQKQSLGELDKVGETLNSMVVHEELPLLDLKRLEVLKEISTLEEKSKQPVHKEVPVADTKQLARLKELRTIADLHEKTKIPVHVELGNIDLSRIQMLQKVSDLYKQTQLPVHNEIKEIKTQRLQEITSVLNYANNIRGSETQINAIDKELVEINIKFEQAQKEQGFKVCPNCKTIILEAGHTH